MVGIMPSNREWPFDFDIERFRRLTAGQRVHAEAILLGFIIDAELARAAAAPRTLASVVSLVEWKKQRHPDDQPQGTG